MWAGDSEYTNVIGEHVGYNLWMTGVPGVQPVYLRNFVNKSLFVGEGGNTPALPWIKTTGSNGGLVSMDQTPLAGQPIFNFFCNSDPTSSVYCGSTRSIPIMQFQAGVGGAYSFEPVTGNFVFQNLKTNQFTTNTFSAAQINVGTATSGPGILKSLRDGTPYSSLTLCHPYGGDNYLGVGNCNSVNNNTSSPDGVLGLQTAYINGSATINNLMAALDGGSQLAQATTNAPGSTARTYEVLPYVNGVLGVHNTYVYMQLNTVASLDGTHTVTITCPSALQPGYSSAGAVYHLVASVLYAPPFRDLGSCTAGGTVVDTGGGTTISNYILHGANSYADAFSHRVEVGGYFGFYDSQYTTALRANIDSPSAGVTRFNGSGIGDGQGSPLALSYTIKNGANSTTLARVSGGSNQTWTLPNAYPGSTSNLTIDTSGNIGYVRSPAKGVANLVAGTVTVSTSSAAPAGTVVYSLTNCGTTNSATIGTLYLSAVVSGTSFTITSTNSGDVSNICWVIQ